jgi:hypothetical protein
MGKMKRLWVWLQENKIKQKGENGLNSIYDIYINNNKHSNRNKKGIK